MLDTKSPLHPITPKLIKKIKKDFGLDITDPAVYASLIDPDLDRRAGLEFNRMAREGGFTWSDF